MESPSEVIVFLKKTYFWFMLRWAASSKETLTWSKTGSVDCFLINQFNSEVYCGMIKLLRSPLIKENKLFVKKNQDVAIHHELPHIYF